MRYTSQHAATALEIMKRLLPAVTPREEYAGLVAILQDPSRWTEAHDQFTAIRTNITLPAEKKKQDDLDSSFAFVAENAAKTAYNCSGADAPFDDGSFQWLLRCEKQFLEKQKKWPNQPLQGTPGSIPSSSTEPGTRRPYRTFGKHLLCNSILALFQNHLVSHPMHRGD